MRTRLFTAWPAAALRVRPQLEALEPRFLPSGVGDPLFPALYPDLLQPMLAGVPPSQVANPMKVPIAHVHPGQSIQAAVDAAIPGTIILIDPAVYAQTVTVARADITLVGLPGPGGVVLQNPGGANDGIIATSAAPGFALVNLTVQGFNENGVLLIGVAGFQLDHVSAVQDGQYGLFPVFCTAGVIQHSSATGHKDTGIYVGQSTNISVVANTTSGNVNGIEIENSRFIRVIGNDTFNNTAGILIDLLPGLATKTDSDIEVSANRVHGNNHVNFGDPGSIESYIPLGIGILVLGADRTVIQNNIITGNTFVGIGVASSLILIPLAHIPPGAFDGLEPNPDNDQIVANYVKGNGTFSSVPFLPAADLLWDGSGVGNCWMNNVFGTSVPDNLPGCH